MDFTRAILISFLQLIIDKVFAYATSHIFENEESCNILEKLIHSCFLVCILL